MCLEFIHMYKFLTKVKYRGVCMCIKFSRLWHMDWKFKLIGSGHGSKFITIYGLTGPQLYSNCVQSNFWVGSFSVTQTLTHQWQLPVLFSEVMASTSGATEGLASCSGAENQTTLCNHRWTATVSDFRQRMIYSFIYDCLLRPSQ